MPLPRTPALTCDCVIFDAKERLLLIRRKYPPFQGLYALPGGFVDIGETVAEACRREVFEETGVAAGELHLTGVYSDPARDPRGHTCSVAFLAQIGEAASKAGDDAEDAIWASDWSDLPVAFDHRKIIADALAVREALKAGLCLPPYRA
jgi:8-oxo-dGTP diphosphatase